MFRQLLKLGVSIGVSFAIVALLLQMVNSGIEDADRPSVWAALQNTSSSYIVIFVALFLLALVFRAIRYRMLLQLSGEANVPALRQMCLITGIRNMVVDMLPARLGELGYVALLNRGYGVKLEHCVSSLTISLAFDFIGLLTVVAGIVLYQFTGDGVQGWAIGTMLMATIVSLIAFIGLFKITPWFTKVVTDRFGTLWSDESFKAKALVLLQKFSSSLMSVHNGGKTLSILSISILIRLLKYLGLFLLFKAVAEPTFESLAELPSTHVLGALIGGEIGASLPIPTFMSFGAYEAGGALIFQLLGVIDQGSAFVTLLCVHIWSQLMEYTLGGFLLAVFILLNRKGKRAALVAEAVGSEARAKFIAIASFVGAGITLLVGTGFLGYQLWAASKLGSVSAPDAGGTAENIEDWRALSKEYVTSLNGFVVFSSNRDGNHDIFKLNLANFELDKLTRHEHTETYPRISPDGNRIVFSRAHQPWVSQRNTVAWDIYMLDLNTGTEKQIGQQGTAPRWINNEEITYLHKGDRVQKVNVNTLATETVFQSGLGNMMPPKSPLQNPTYNPLKDSLAFTAKQAHIGTNTGHWGTALSFGNKIKGVMNGCELAWSTGGDYLYQVNPDAESLRIMRIDPDSLESETMIDLDGEFSHEYWPKDSFNGEYMVFGASRGPKDHEHDTKDYEIFLWKVGSASSKATRLTFHTGNDNWPDVFIR
ncbi:MAG: lysylphosphatidylglycerol synthase domain-containing protein [Gammaproteobacteria bacterium]|nr:lysylphosphatidylglycerol synthase domain-containing protein [Gammaproteobacteria bacterium]